MPTECASERKVVGCDQEYCVKERLTTLVRMAITLHTNSWCGADDILKDGGMEGIINGDAIEIIHTLGLQPCYVNLRSNKNVPTGDKESVTLSKIWKSAAPVEDGNVVDNGTPIQ